MTKNTLRTVALETVANYRQVAEHAVGAYRASGHRLLAVMSRNLERGTRRIAPTLAEALQQTTSKVGAVAAKGIDSVSARTERAIEIGSTGVNLPAPGKRPDRLPASLATGLLDTAPCPASSPPSASPPSPSSGARSARCQSSTRAPATS